MWMMLKAAWSWYWGAVTAPMTEEDKLNILVW